LPALARRDLPSFPTRRSSDLAMRSAVARMGKDPKIIEPLVPVDLVVDHSVQVDFAGTPDALQRNLDMEFRRNRERYQFLKWGMQDRKSTRLNSSHEWISYAVF